MIQAFLSQALERILNTTIAMDPDSREAIQQFDGRVIAFYLIGPEITLYLTCHGHHIGVSFQSEEAPDVTLRGSPLAFFKLSLAENPTTLSERGVEIAGDVALGQSFKRFWDEFAIDWEEHLSKILGDVVAHQCMQLLGRASRWGQSTKETLIKNVTEYTQEELRWFPTRYEVEAFNNAVDDVRMQADRLEARLNMIQKRQAQ